MNDDKPSLSEAIRLLAERDRRSLGAHPKIEELAAYHAGELEPQAAARVREHISVCRECSDLLLDLINFADLTPPPGEPDLTDDEMEQDWQALRARMGEGKAEEPKEPVRPTEVVPIRPAATAPAPNLGRTHSPWLPIAASLLAVLGFSFGLFQYSEAEDAEKRLKEAQRASVPSVPQVFDITLGDVTRGGSGSESGQTIRMSSKRGGIVFLYSDGAAVREYQIEILQGDRILWQTTVAGGDEVPISIPAGYLKPGHYTLRFVAGEVAHDSALEVDD